MHNDDSKYSEIDPGMQKDQGSKGGISQGQEEDSGNIAGDPKEANESGEKGGKASQQSGSTMQKETQNDSDKEV